MLCGTPALAADHTNLEENLGSPITDAYPIGRTSHELQEVTRYERAGGDSDRLIIEPRLEAGVAPNTQMSVAVPLELDELERFGVESVELEAMYNFNQETLIIPALSVAGGIGASNGLDPSAKVLLTKTIPGTSYRHRVHVNAEVLLNMERDRDAGEGRVGYLVGAAYDFRLSATATALISAARQRRATGEEDETLGELGLRYQLLPLWVIAVGIGAGADDEGAAVARGTVGVQFRAF